MTLQAATTDQTGRAVPPQTPSVEASEAPEPRVPEVTGTANNPLISVIIPVYNAGVYFRPCVDSVLAQTHRNLQVILVDDGSTDGSEAICDEYAARDARVEVIHQQNAGLSAARNTGIERARGAYLAFADADDVVMPDWIEYLLAGAVSHGAQIATCDIYVAPELRQDTFGPQAGEPAPEGFHAAHGNGLLVLGRRDAMALLIADDILQNYAWDKLWDARLWDDVRFPVGRVFEDVATTYRVLQRAERLVMLPQAKYVYVPLSTGIVKRRSLKNEMDSVHAHQQRYQDLAGDYPELRDAMSDGIAHAMIGLWQVLWTQRHKMTPQMRAELRQFAAFVRDNPPSDELVASLGPTGRLTLPLLRHANVLSWLAAHVLNRAYLRRHPEWAPASAADVPTASPSRTPAAATPADQTASAPSAPAATTVERDA